MKVAVVILNYNSSSDCWKCVSSLKRQVGVDTELILVDNCSTEKDVLALRQLAEEQGCTLMESKENRGYNAGNNIGLRYAVDKGYKYALIANPDMEFPQTDYLLQLFEQMQKNLNIVICGSDIQTPDGVHQNPKDNGMDSWQTSFDWIQKFFYRQGTKTVPDWVGNPYESQFCRVLNGCCLLLRLSFIKEIDFFDERTFLYGEESILGKQVEMVGKRAYYFADTYAIHNHKKSKEGNAAFRFKHWKHSRLLYISKYSGYPFYGKLFAIFSTELYFFLLTIHDSLLRKILDRNVNEKDKTY